jgi:TctA family transporter
MRVGQGDITILFSSPLGDALWLMVIAALVLPYWRSRRQAGVLAQAAQAGHES